VDSLIDDKTALPSGAEPAPASVTPASSAPGTEHKAWYRKLEKTLESIERSEDVALMLSASMASIVRDFQEDLAVVGGRLYRRQRGKYVLTDQTGKSSAPLGYKIPLHYHPIKVLLKSGYLLMRESDPGFDQRIEDVVGAKVFAAILVGQEDEYCISFTLKGKIDEGRTSYALNTIRHVLNLKMREQALSDSLLEAKEIQVSLLPKTAPTMKEYDIHARSIPAEVVGGDLFDYIPISDGVLGVAIADASGHGLPAALQARDVIIGLRMGMAEDLKIVKTLEKLNRVINRSALASKFVSLFYGELEVNGNFIYSNCGHPPPLLYHRERFVELKEGGPVLGPTVGTRFLRGYVHVRPGDLLVLYTDGISEAADGGDEEFGVQRIRQVIAENLHRTAPEIVERLLKAVQDFSGRKTPLDDQTVVVIKPRKV
jgi:sigma-B regulation protein RsbU (phosphoserine phosphatase)